MDLLKRATRPLPREIDAMSLDDVVSQVDVVLECQSDGEIARLLAGRIVKAVRGKEWSFDKSKLDALVRLADGLAKDAPKSDGDRAELRKAADVLKPEPAFPADLQARVDTTVAMIKRAGTEEELRKALAAGERLRDDLERRNAVIGAQARPKTIPDGMMQRFA